MTPDQNSVRELAYRLWEERGRPQGRPEEDWYAAERRLSDPAARSKLVDEAVKESFPASDPPATGLPDEPPANAEEKWAARSATRSRKPRAKGETKSSGGNGRRYAASDDGRGKNSGS